MAAIGLTEAAMQKLNPAVRIRHYRSDDSEALYAAVIESVDLVGAWLPWCTSKYSRADAVGWIKACADDWKQASAFPFAVEDVGSGAILGGVGISQINRLHKTGNIGYWIRTSRAGTGVATRAVRQLAHWALDSQQFYRLEIVTRLENAASRRVAEKVGSTFEYIARNRLLENGISQSAAVYSLVPDDLVKSQ